MIKVGAKSNPNNQNLDLKLSNKEGESKNDLFENIFSSQGIVSKEENVSIEKNEKDIDFEHVNFSPNNIPLLNEHENNTLIKDPNLGMLLGVSYKMKNDENDLDISNNEEVNAENQNEIVNPIFAVSSIKSEKELIGNSKESKNKLNADFSSNDVEGINIKESNNIEIDVPLGTFHNETQKPINQTLSNTETNNIEKNSKLDIKPNSFLNHDKHENNKLEPNNSKLQNFNVNNQDNNETSLNQHKNSKDVLNKQKEIIADKSLKEIDKDFEINKKNELKSSKHNLLNSKVDGYDQKMIIKSKNKTQSTNDREIVLSSSLKNNLKSDLAKTQRSNHIPELSTNNSLNLNNSNLSQQQSNNFSSQNQSGNIQTINEMKEMLDLADKKWTESLIAKINKTKSGGKNELEIMLKPKHLGKMTIKISVMDDQTMVSIKTDNPNASTLILDQENRLSQMFENAGIRLSNLNSDSLFQGNHKKDSNDPNNKGMMKEKEKKISEQASDSVLEEKKLNNNDLLNIEV